MLSRDEAHTRQSRDTLHAENGCTSSICYCAGLPGQRDGAEYAHAPDCRLGTAAAICECLGNAYAALDLPFDRTRPLTAEQERMVLNHWKKPNGAALSLASAPTLASPTTTPSAVGPSAAERAYSRSLFLALGYTSAEHDVFTSTFNAWDAWRKWGDPKVTAPAGGRTFSWSEYFNWFASRNPAAAAAYPRIFDGTLEDVLGGSGNVAPATPTTPQGKASIGLGLSAISQSQEHTTMSNEIPRDVRAWLDAETFKEERELEARANQEQLDSVLKAPASNRIMGAGGDQIGAAGLSTGDAINLLAAERVLIQADAVKATPAYQSQRRALGDEYGAALDAYLSAHPGTSAIEASQKVLAAHPHLHGAL